MAAILLARCGINSLFDSIVTTVEAGKSKPAPDVYLMAAQKIGVIPANCIVFEDSPNGISSAKEAGMFCVAVQTDGVTAQELSKADVLVNSFVGLNLQRLFELIADKCVLQPPN